jgi:hypothetical protein
VPRPYWNNVELVFDRRALYGTTPHVELITALQPIKLLISMSGQMKHALILLLLALSGCKDAPADNKQAKKQAMKEQAKLVVSKTPQPRTYNFDGHQLVVVDIPSADEAGYVEVQKCYVWRDVEFKTSSISCPAEQSSP